MQISFCIHQIFALTMFWDITGTPRGETVKVAAWYITHAHGDHFQGFRQFTYEYSQYLDLERIAFGFPSVNSPTTALSTGSGANGYSQIASLVNAYYSDDDPIVFRLHTGQEFNLADVSFEVLYTHEDGVDAKTGVSYITNYNDASSVVRITMDGETFLILGDASIKSAQRNLLANWSGEYLKSDGIQISHHVMDNITNLYNTVKAAVVFVPQSRYNVELYSNRVAILEVAISHARSDMIFYQNEYTVGIAVVDGRWEKVYTLPVIYDLRK